MIFDVCNRKHVIEKRRSQMEAELNEIIALITENVWFVPIVLVVILAIVAVTVFSKERNVRALLSESVVFAVKEAKERGWTVEEIYDRSVERAIDVVSKKAAEKGVYGRYMSKLVAKWISSSWVKGIVTEFIRERLHCKEDK